MSEEKLVRHELKLERTYPDDLQTHFVIELTVQSQRDYFILSFFESWPPPLIGETEEEIQEQLEQIGSSVEAKCVARLVVPAEKMKSFIDAMARNHAKWERMIEELGKAEQDT